MPLPHALYGVLLLLLCTGVTATPSIALLNITFVGGLAPCSSDECPMETTTFPTYVCNERDDNNTIPWTQIEMEFLDPLPPNTTLVQVEAELSGSFYCNVSSSTVALFVNSGLIKTFTPPFTQCTACKNCANSVEVRSANFEQGWTDYSYGGNNTFHIISFIPNQLCASKANLRFFYRPRKGSVFSARPRMSPVGKPTAQVKIFGQDFFPSNDLGCRFGNKTVTGEYETPVSVICPVPLEVQPITTSLEFTQDGEKYDTVVEDYRYYVEPVLSSFSPTGGSSVSSEAPDVWLYGSGFFNSTDMLCKFNGNLPVAAKYVNETAVICLSPGDNTGSDPRNVTVNFAENGSDFEAAPGEYLFFGRGTVTPPPPTPTVVDDSDGTPSSTGDDTIPGYIWLIVALAGAMVVAVVTAAILLTRYRNQPSGPTEKSPLMEGVAVEIARDPHSIPLEEITDLELLEKGSFGVIYRAQWNGTTIAMKKLPSTNLSDRLLSEFYAEAELMKSMRHPNVLQYLGTAYAPSGKEVCICMEYMPLGSLYRLIHDEKVPLPLERIQSICLDTARGMSYLHNQSPPIVHRDLKSHNLLVDEHWRVKVCDFGLSRFISQNATMTACGTPSWTAPEVLRNEKYTVKADVYGFGIVVWEMFARDDPFPGMPPFQIVFAVGTQSLRPAIRSDWPEEWVSLIQDCWCEDSDARPSFAEVITRLQTMVATPGAEDEVEAGEV